MNKDLFGSNVATTRNEAGGLAYDMSPKAALAQLACTGTFADTFYVSAQDQLDKMLELAKEVDDEFLAKLAVYSRERGKMKDMPAVLTALLVCRGTALADVIFPTVVDNGRMLRNFVQAMRSGRLGRRSLGGRAKRLVREWFAAKDSEYIFKQSVGNDPSLADVIKLAHPRPATPERKALYGLLIGQEVDPAALPELARELLKFRAAAAEDAHYEVRVPRVPFQMVDSLPLTEQHWRDLFARSGYQFCRMNLNTAHRKGLMADPEFVANLATKLKDPGMIQNARQMPYQFLVAYLAACATGEMPRPIINALHDAMEVAVANVPELTGRVVVAVDCSGSMGCPVTGHRGSATTAARYCDVAGLFAAAIVRKNPDARVAVFAESAAWANVEPRDTVMTTARELSRNGGGTNCAAPLELVNNDSVPCDLFVMVSDDQSWLDSGMLWGYHRSSGSTSSVQEWRRLKARCPQARMVRININPSTTSQLRADKDVLLVGGFSDAVFDAVAAFQKNLDWVRHIEETRL